MANPLFQVDMNIELNEQRMIECNKRTGPVLASGGNIGLSCYEMACCPRKITNESELTFNMNKISRVIKEVLKCTICFELFQEPVNIKSCLHKFCKKCIEDYNRKVKKLCAICRHSVENRRLTKEDARLRGINIEKFKNEEEKEIQNCLPQLGFKDKKRMEIQKEKEKIFNYDIPNNNIICDQDNDNIEPPKIIPVDNSNNLPSNLEMNISQTHISHNLLNKKMERINDLNAGFEGKNIEIKLNCDDSEENIKKYFAKTKLMLQDNFTLEFVSRFICYKQSFNAEIINKIIFYTLTKNKEKKFWDQHSAIREIRDDSIKEFAMDNQFHTKDEKITLFFLIKH